MADISDLFFIGEDKKTDYKIYCIKQSDEVFYKIGETLVNVRDYNENPLKYELGIEINKLRGRK